LWCLRIETGDVLVSYDRGFIYNYCKNSLHFYCATMNCLRQTVCDAVDKNQSIISHSRSLWFILMFRFHVWLCPFTFVKPSRMTKILYEFMISLMCVNKCCQSHTPWLITSNNILCVMQLSLPDNSDYWSCIIILSFSTGSTESHSWTQSWASLNHLPSS